MSGTYPSLRPFYGKPWTEWLDQVEKKLPTMSINDKVEKSLHPTVSLLPRKDILLYGSCPKTDVRVLCQCERCGKLLMPISYVSHMKEKHGPDQVHQPAPTTQSTSSMLKKKYPYSKSKKKISPPPVPPPPLFQTYEAPVPASPIQAPAAVSAASAAVTTSATATTAAAIPAAATAPPTIVQAAETKPTALQQVHAAKSEQEVLPASTAISSAIASTTTNISSGSAGSGSSVISSSKHKKSKKSSKKVKEFDPNKHCGVVEGNKGPCLRSITCSNHMIHLRKAVPGRSKDLHQLITEHKAAKDKEPVKLAHVSLLPKPEVYSTDRELISPASSSQIVTSTPTATTLTTSTTSTTSKSSDMHVITQPLHISVPTTAVSVSSQGNNETAPSSVVYMPMSPVAIVSPVQFVQFGGPILRVASTQPMLNPPLATQPIVVTIPVQSSNAPQYPAHPKPLIMSSCSTRKIGGTFVLQNQRVDRQRSEIQATMNTRRSISNSCSVMNAHHKPNILKNSIRGGNVKISVKRQSSDKVTNDNNKHIRLSDVNGFILHADVSESAEAPQANNSIHEKVTFVNMK